PFWSWSIKSRPAGLRAASESCVCLRLPVHYHRRPLKPSTKE
ncbi:hypothetical protein LEMLEM_LOCUS24788, partial [Lemmus lemmus]